MLRRYLVACVAPFALTVAASADLVELPSGTNINRYNLNYGSGQITHSEDPREFGPATVWDSTSFTGSFRNGALTEEVVDWGDVANGTQVNGFQFAYATDSTLPVDMEVNFYLGNGFSANGPTLVRFGLTGLPASTTGSLAAFAIDVDLEGGGEFLISGPDVDAFAGTDFAYGIIPQNFGNGTTLGPLISTGGFGEEDAFDTYGPGALADGAPYVSTLFFGGSPFAQFHMRLYAVPEASSFLCLGLVTLLGAGGTACCKRWKRRAAKDEP